MPVAGAGQDRAADVVILPEVDPGRGNGVRCRLVEDVRLFRIVQRDIGDAVALFVVDTNVFVAAGFNPNSASAHLLDSIREGRFRLIWNQPTQRETEMILRRIPRLDWRIAAD